MQKYKDRQALAIRETARQAAMAANLMPRDDAFGAIERRTRKIVDAANSINEERADSIVGIRIVNGRITDVVATNGGVRIEG
jgi:hypothetical protein